MANKKEYPKMIVVGDKRIKVNDAVEEAQATGSKLDDVKKGKTTESKPVEKTDDKKDWPK